MQFFKDKFELMVVTIVFMVVFIVWINSDYRGDVKEFLIAVFGAWLTLMRIVQRPSNIQADTITADSIDTAKTGTGDIISTSPPTTAIRSKE